MSSLKPFRNFPKSIFTTAFIFLALGSAMSACSSKSTKESAKSSEVVELKIIPSVAVNPTSEIPARREFPVNTNISPCTDFYQYTCSNALAGFKMREDRSYHSFAFSDSSERILEAKKKFMTEIEKIPNSKLTLHGRDLKANYVACMNPKARAAEERSEVQRIEGILKHVKTREDFLKLISKNILSSDFSFFSLERAANQDEPLQYDAFFFSGLTSLPERSYYDKPEVVAGLENIVEDFFNNIHQKDAKLRAQKLVAFEKANAQTVPLPKEFRERFSQRNPIERSALTTALSQIDLKAVFSQIGEKTKLRDLTPENFKFINEQLATADLDLLKDLYRFHALQGLLDDAYPKFFNNKFVFYQKHLGGPNVRPDRQERCTKMVMSSFGKELDAELLPRMFPDFPTAKFISFVERIRAAIVSGVEQNTWLSPQGKAGAIEKMKTARLQLVKPMNDEEWDFNPKAKYYNNKPILNSRNLNEAEIKKMLVEFKTPRDPNRWGMSPLTVNAYYSTSDNKFVLPIGILQYPFYDPKLSDEVNFGGIGAVIGHELGHGIDDKGSKYDSKGKLHQWMTDGDLNEFQKRSSTLTEQFNKIGHDGVLTLGENTADLVGLTFAYHAAFPDGQATVEQKKNFFLQFARVWCYTARPTMIARLLKTDSHSMGSARTNEQMKHQAAFAEAFQCHDGDAMYLAPTARTKIW